MVTALFPIKGQLPHIGHILTVVRIYDEYDEISKDHSARVAESGMLLYSVKQKITLVDGFES